MKTAVICHSTVCFIMRPSLQEVALRIAPCLTVCLSVFLVYLLQTHEPKALERPKLVRSERRPCYDKLMKRIWRQEVKVMRLTMSDRRHTTFNLFVFLWLHTKYYIRRTFRVKNHKVIIAFLMKGRKCAVTSERNFKLSRGLDIGLWSKWSAVSCKHSKADG